MAIMSWHPTLSLLRNWGRFALDSFAPPACFVCRNLLDPYGSRSGALCSKCFGSLNFISRPYCECCGLPFEYDLGAGVLCAACMMASPVYQRGRAVLRYDDAARPVVLAFKHGDRTEGAATFAHWMARAAPDLLAEADCLVPVPLHWLRLFRRRYNQSALMALALSRLTGKPAYLDFLKRIRATASQGYLSRRQRWHNVRKAFAVTRRGSDILAGRKVVLVDDVLTTGATAEAAIRCLMAAGVQSVDLLVLARVVHPRETVFS